MDVTDKEILALQKLDKSIKEKDDLKKQIYSLKKTLEEYGATEYSPINNVEFICLKAIEHLKDIVIHRPLDDKEAKTLDTLYKNLRMARGKLETRDTGEAKSVDDLLRIIDGKK